jgi:excisionase family DNA binding protein
MKRERSMKHPVPAKSKYMSISEVAAILGMSRTAVYKKIKRGDIKAIKIGNILGIPRNSLANIDSTVIDPAKKKRIDRAVKKVVSEYGELLKRLGNE